MTAAGLAQRFSLAGRRAVVTGASSGLGRHFARVLAAAGAEVFVCARRTDKLAELVVEIANDGGRAHAVAMDVTDRISICAALDAISGIDVLVNNAGVGRSKRPLAYTDEDWDAVVGTNLTGAWKMAQETARRMVELKIEGSIINVTSILASRGGAGMGPYMAAKAGLKHLTRSLALDLARHNIRVNSLAPGYILTDINREFLKSAAGGDLKHRIPNRRFGEPEDLDGALLLLASSASAYMTGSEIVIDGGHLCSGL